MRRETITEVLRASHDREMPFIVPRDLDAKFPSVGKCVTLIGPRRAGKTYYLYQKVAEVRSASPDEEAMLLNLEDERLAGLSLKDMDLVLRTFREMYPGSIGLRTHIFLDEVQVVEGWERFVRRLIDTEDVHIHITGSSSRLLYSEIGYSMRGRSITYTLLPFSFAELLRARKTPVGRYPSSDETAVVLSSLQEYMRFGGFPQVALEQSEGTKVELLRELIELILLKDVVERNSVRNVTVLRLLLNTILTSMGREFSVNRFYALAKSREMKVSKKTLYDYLRHLEDAFAIIQLRRYSRKPKELHWSLPKVYPIDPGFAAQASGQSTPDIGRAMECVVAVELVRRRTMRPRLETYYWRDPHGKEVDFVVRDGVDTTALIQVCYDLEGLGTREREYNPLVKASRELGCDDLTVLTWDELDEEEYEGKRIKLVPLWRWLLGLETAL
jgi:hypothetical protein